MHPASSTSITSSETPAPSNKASRPRLRGFNYLRGHSASYSASNPSSNISATPDRGRFVRSTSSLAESSPDRSPHAINNSILPSVPGPNETQANTYLENLESALRPSPLLSSGEDPVRTMARNRSGSAPNAANAANAANGSQNAANSASSSLTGHPQDQMPTIRLIPHQDPRSARPSLNFPATSRTLPHEDCVIRVGRYSERDSNPNPPPNTPSSAPVGFKSKVVSRRHCEFWCSHGQWYIKDMKSSSGTFLNHIRLSPPSAESKPFPVHDGDVVQLGIDFRGGEEMIFRCVKIKVECNRAWQKTLNNYNVQTHKRLRDLGRSLPKKDSDTASVQSSDCSICLGAIAPCQPLFVAPCSHVWHYKCVRPLLNDQKSYPQFTCPNCRAATDLEADVDEPATNGWEEDNDAQSSFDLLSTRADYGDMPENHRVNMRVEDERLSKSTSRVLSMQDESHSTGQSINSTDVTHGSGSSAGLLSRRGAQRISPPFTPANNTPTQRAPSNNGPYLRPITPTQPLLEDDDLHDSAMRTPPTENFAHDGPMTPTNNAGPFVFDGSAGRVVGRTGVDVMSETEDVTDR